MKNGKWMPLDLKDVRKDMLVLYGKSGFTPKSCEPSKITDVVFDIHGEIFIKLGDCVEIRIVDLVRDTDGQKMQLHHWVPLTAEEKLTELIAAVDGVLSKAAHSNRGNCWDSVNWLKVPELQELIEEFRKE